MQVRASIGTLAALKLVHLDMLEAPTTAYLLQYSFNGCSAQCIFCSQSSSSKTSKDLVSRVTWPKVELEKIIHVLKSLNPFFRICIQTVLKQDFEVEIVKIVKLIRNAGVKLPISIGTTPLNIPTLETLKNLGVDYLGVGLDVACAEKFNLYKKPFNFENLLEFIAKSVKVFGSNHVYVHLIYGLGEKEIEFVKLMEDIYHRGASVALFSFTPVAGTPAGNFPPPKLERYRLMQIVRFLLSKGYTLQQILEDQDDGIKLKIKINEEVSDSAFLTSGCPGCNRPFYNERPTQIYNYPSSRSLARESELIRRQVSKIFE